MNKQRVMMFGLLFFMFSLCLSAQIQQPFLLREIRVGSEKGQIGVFPGGYDVPIPRSPQAAFCTADGHLAIYDYVNSQINYYSLPGLVFAFEKSAPFYHLDWIFPEKEYMWLTMGEYLWDIASYSGEKIKRFNFSGAGKNYSFMRDGYLWKRVRDVMQWECADKDGKAYEGEAAKNIIREKNKKIYEGRMYGPEIDSRIVSMIEAKEYPLILNGIFIYGSKDMRMQWYNLFQESSFISKEKGIVLPEGFDVSDGTFLQLPPDISPNGTALLDVSLPHGDDRFVLVNNFGTPLVFFNYDNINSFVLDKKRATQGLQPENKYWRPVAIFDHSGNIYFLTVENKKKIQIYTLKRTW